MTIESVRSDDAGEMFRAGFTTATSGFLVAAFFFLIPLPRTAWPDNTLSFLRSALKLESAGCPASAGSTARVSCRIATVEALSFWVSVRLLSDRDNKVESPGRKGMTIDRLERSVSRAENKVSAVM